MAATHILIASNTLSSSAASVTFSSIPSTYTDLVLRCSVRNTAASTTATLKINLNNDSTSIYSWTRLRGDGSSPASARSSNTGYVYGGIIDATLATTNVFSPVEIYIPSYGVSQNRVINVSTVQEDSNSTAYIDVIAGLYQSTTAVSRIDLSNITSNFQSGSSFYLYGIKSS